jgi:hypothetical protein
LVFISDNFVFGKLDNLAPNHHEAVGGFFDASQERADNTSFEGYESLERGSERPLIGVTAKSAGRAVADALPIIDMIGYKNERERDDLRKT